MTKLTIMSLVRPTKVVLFVGGFSLLSHIFALGVNQIETWLSDTISEAQASIVGTISSSYGLAPVIPELPISELIERAAEKHSVNPDLLTALMLHESNGDPLAFSHAGAIGLLQVMPSNSKRCGLRPGELLVPELNIDCGAKIFSEDIAATKGDLVAALMKYNGGPKCQAGGCKESRNHAYQTLKILARLRS